MKKVLLHICCGPCTLYPLDQLRQKGWSVHGFFYNPYIQPYQEFKKRLETLQSVAGTRELPLILREDYDLTDYLRKMAFREENRCIVCYSKRLEATARLAQKSGFDAFTTTLLFSKRQQHNLIRELAACTANRLGVGFVYEDFREGWKLGQEAARELKLYRQQYCGCILSEKDRYAPSQKAR